jgi:hypothetical protein
MGNGQLRLDEVYLTGSTGQGPAVVGGLALVADEKGLSVLGPQPTSVRTMPWGRVSTMAARQTAQLPDGRGAVTLEMEIGGQALRFLVPEAALGPQGIGILEGRLSSLARIPVRASLPLADPVAIGAGGAASGGGGVSAPPGVVLPGQGPALGASGDVGSSQPGTVPVSGFAPATGGTLLGGQTGPGQAYVQVGKRHPGRAKQIAVVAVVLVLLGGAGAFYEREHKASPTTGTSADSLIAAQVNLDPGQVPGWKGVPGTTAGVLGAYGFRDAPAGHETVLHEAASGFAKCAKLPVQESQAALTTLGFSEGLGEVSGQTASSSSPLFEDPAQAATSAESQALVLATKAEQTADFSAFTQRDFAPCYSRFLDAVVPDLVGSSMSGTPFAFASVRATRAQPLESGIRAAGFTETFMRKGRTNTVALSGSIEVVGGGRTIAAVETLTAHRFPLATTLKLFASMQQNVAGESS